MLYDFFLSTYSSTTIELFDVGFNLSILEDPKEHSSSDTLPRPKSICFRDLFLDKIKILLMCDNAHSYALTYCS